MAQKRPKTEAEAYFGQCRCCLGYAYLKDMWAPHLNHGKREVFGKMLVDCFSISWSSHDQDERMCEKCILRLQNAIKFKNQVTQLQNNLISQTGLLGKVHKVSMVGGLYMKFASDIDTDNESFTEEVLEDKHGAVNEDDEFSYVEFLDEDIINDDLIEIKGNETSTVKKKQKKKPKLEKVKNRSGCSPPYIELPLREVKLDVDYKIVNKKYHCCHCGITCACVAYIKGHVNAVHLKTPRYGCAVCPETFVYRESLLDHQIKKHNIGVKYQCDLCDAVYCWKNKLIRHIKERHLLNKLYECDKCTYKSYVHSQYARHLVEHTLEKKYRCSLCVKSFKKPNALRYHEMAHRGDKPYVCSLCGKAFVQIGHLTYHMKKFH